MICDSQHSGDRLLASNAVMGMNVGFSLDEAKKKPPSEAAVKNSAVILPFKR